MEDTTKQQILRLIQSEKEARSKALSGQTDGLKKPRKKHYCAECGCVWVRGKTDPRQAYGFIAGYTESILGQIEQLLLN